MTRSLTALAAALVLAVPATAAHAKAQPVVPGPPSLLPGDAAAASFQARPGTWIVGARPSAAAAAVARRFGATAFTAHGAYLVTRTRARSFAAALRRRGLLVYSEPDSLASNKSVMTDPLSADATWREFIVPADVTEPPVTPTSPELALIDTQLDTTHPEFAGSNIRSTLSGAPSDEHGTATAAVAAAPVNGVGIAGFWPGMRAVNYATGSLACSVRAGQIGRAIRNGAAVVNMSYGSNGICYAEFTELQYATARGVVTVAAAGNEFADNNPLEYPASLPHVLTVAAITPSLQPASFSNSNAAVDLAAPGAGILTAVPLKFDDDGPRDGYAHLSGTSFSAPMVAAAAAWVKAARPGLSGGQVAQAVRLSARDIGPKGYDTDTGFGLLDIKSALKLARPLEDPLEPNDGIVWVDGRAFGRADPPIFRSTSRRAALDAILDQYEDPLDVYRVVMPARRRVRFDVKPRFGDSDVAVFNLRAKLTTQTRYLLGRSQHNGTRLDRITLLNRSHRPATVYVEVYINPAVRGLDSLYRLTVSRL